MFEDIFAELTQGVEPNEPKFTPESEKRMKEILERMEEIRNELMSFFLKDDDKSLERRQKLNNEAAQLEKEIEQLKTEADKQSFMNVVEVVSKNLAKLVAENRPIIVKVINENKELVLSLFNDFVALYISSMKETKQGRVLLMKQAAENLMEAFNAFKSAGFSNVHAFQLVLATKSHGNVANALGELAKGASVVKKQRK